MKAVALEQTLAYDGSQLRSHWIYETAGVDGDAIAWFLGPSEVPTDGLVDLRDRREGDHIRAEEMLHFIAEHFDPDLERAVLRQRLLVAIAAEVVSAEAGAKVDRQGDDLYVRTRKLSVSVATVSPVSGLVHLGINIDPTGAPVPAIGLRELVVPPALVGEKVASRYAEEMRSVGQARVKVRWVR